VGGESGGVESEERKTVTGDLVEGSRLS